MHEHARGESTTLDSFDFRSYLHVLYALSVLHHRNVPNQKGTQTLLRQTDRARVCHSKASAFVGKESSWRQQSMHTGMSLNASAFAGKASSGQQQAMQAYSDEGYSKQKMGAYKVSADNIYFITRPPRELHQMIPEYLCSSTAARHITWSI